MKRHILLGGRAFVGDIDLVALVLTGEDCGNYILTVPHIPCSAGSYGGSFWEYGAERG